MLEHAARWNIFCRRCGHWRRQSDLRRGRDVVVAPESSYPRWFYSMMMRAWVVCWGPIDTMYLSLTMPGFVEVVDDGVFERGGTEPALGFFEFSLPSTASIKRQDPNPVHEEWPVLFSFPKPGVFAIIPLSAAMGRSSARETSTLNKVTTYFRLIPCNSLPHLLFSQKSARFSMTSSH